MLISQYIVLSWYCTHKQWTVSLFTLLMSHFMHFKLLGGFLKQAAGLNCERFKWYCITFVTTRLFYAGVNLGHSHWGRNTGWTFSKIQCWGGYQGLTGTRKWESAEDCITKSFMLGTPRQIYFGCSNQKE